MLTSMATVLNECEEEWFDLFSEGVIWCDKYELYQLIDFMERKKVNINSLQIQTCADGSFICKIDIDTVEYYKYAVDKKKGES